MIIAIQRIREEKETGDRRWRCLGEREKKKAEEKYKLKDKAKIMKEKQNSVICDSLKERG